MCLLGMKHCYIICIYIYTYICCIWRFKAQLELDIELPDFGSLQGLEHCLIFQYVLGGGFKHFLFLPLPGEMIQFD